MKDLSVLMSTVLRPYTNAEAADKCGVARETIRKLRTGGTTKLSTLQSICAVMGTSREDWVEIVMAWTLQELGTEATHLRIESRGADTSQLREGPASLESQAIALFHELNADDRIEIIKAMQRPEVRRCLEAINDVWERLEPSTP